VGRLAQLRQAGTGPPGEVAADAAGGPAGA
jgi:hypothetical protein